MKISYSKKGDYYIPNQKGKMSKTSYKSIKLVKFCYWKFMEYVVCLYKTKNRTQN